MAKISALVHNRNFIFILAIVCGLGAPHGADWTKPLVIPGLAVVMTISTLGIPNSVFRSPRSLIMPALKGFLMNYLLLATIIIILSFLMIRDEALRIGFILIAASPPAVAVIPFADVLGADTGLALIGTIGAYLAALIVMPFITIQFIGTSFMEPWRLATVMLQLIIAPLLVSRLILWRGWHNFLAKPSGLITNWSFFIVLYTIVGFNHTAIISQPFTIIPVVLATFISIFLVGYLIERIGRHYHIPEASLTSLNLLGTLKNYGLSGGLALAFFSREASLPSAVGTVFLILYFIWLDFRKKKYDSRV